MTRAMRDMGTACRAAFVAYPSDGGGNREMAEPSRRTEEGHRALVPVLEPRPGGAAERFADMLGGSHPAAVFAAALVCGYVALLGVSLLLALLVTDVLVPTAGIGHADESAIVSLA